MAEHDGPRPVALYDFNAAFDYPANGITRIAFPYYNVTLGIVAPLHVINS
jgi:hypothetical protein